jgi:hemerythrin superfamily protein
MDALELLKSQHEEVKSLFKEIEKTEDEDDKLALFEELADSFAAHATIEEKIFYPAAYASATQELLNEAVEEHLAAKRTLADLLEMSPDDEQFEAKVKVLQEQIDHHVQEEEGELFPKVRDELDAPQLEALGAQMEEMFEAEMEESPAEKVPTETKKAASIKPRKPGKGGKRQPARQ